MWRGHELFASSLPMLVEYIPVTLFYFLTPTIISLFLGALLCKIRTGKKNLSYYLASLFVSFFRGTPGLVQIYIIFFGLPYYFDQDGIMQTGWLDDGGKRYYLDEDGIMQTGDITVDGETYHLNEDGSLENYKSEFRDEEKKEASAEDDKKKESAGAVALTFDDGPSSFTDRLLDCLEKNQSKATFFMVGEEINNFPDTVQRMESLGCELGNHSYTHTDFTTLSTEDMSAEIAGVDELLVNLVGHGATVVRPPYGSVNDNVRATVGTPMILWSIDTLDWETQDAQTTVDTVMENVADGSIILMHDIFSASVDAVEMLVPRLLSEGYELVTIHELAKRKGVELQTGVTYGSFE